MVHGGSNGGSYSGSASGMSNGSFWKWCPFVMLVVVKVVGLVVVVSVTVVVKIMTIGGDCVCGSSYYGSCIYSGGSSSGCYQ